MSSQLTLLSLLSQTGRKSWLTVEEMRLYRAERANAPMYIKIYRALFSN